MEATLSERAEHWASIREAGMVAGMRFMVAVHGLLGRTVFRLLLYPVMAYFLLRRRTAREASFAYLRRVREFVPGLLPERSDWRLSFRHFLLPLVHKWPVDRTHPEIRHVLIAFEAVEGGADQVLGLLAVRGFDTRDPGEAGIVAVVLLILRGMHTGIVCADDDQSSRRSDQADGHERIGRDIQPHMFHTDQGPFPCIRHAQPRFHGSFLIGGPLSVDVPFRSIF